MSYKINGFIFICILSTTLVLSVYFYRVFLKENREHSIHTLKTSTYAVNSILEPDMLLEFNHRNSYKAREYKILWDKIKDLEKQLELKYVYVLLLNQDKKLVFLFDSGDKSEVFGFKNQDQILSSKFEDWFNTKVNENVFEGDLLSYFQIYIDAPKEAYLAIENKNFTVAKEYTDQWGTFLSAFLPIVYKGEVIGLIGADYEISYIKELERRTLYVILSVILFAVFLNIIIGILLRQIFIKPILSLAESTKLIADGNLITEIQIRKSITRDEVTDLFKNFAFMSSKLSENFSRIENYSKEIERLSKTKDEFLANLSHELKTPLSVVFAYAEMLTMDEEYPEEVKNYSQEIYSNAQKLNDYVNDVILVTDIESKIKLQKSIVSIRDLILNSIKHLKPLSEEKEIELELKLSEDIQINCDSTLLEKAIIAILKNAIVYNRQKGKVSIEMRKIQNLVLDAHLYSLKPEFQIKITDTGIGIAEEFQDKVFEKFFRIDSSLTYEVSGVGVGLFIAKKIIELHEEGSIELKSSLNEGTEVTIKMPINQ